MKRYFDLIPAIILMCFFFGCKEEKKELAVEKPDKQETLGPEVKAEPVQVEKIDLEAKLKEIEAFESKRLYKDAAEILGKIVSRIHDPELKKKIERRKVFNELNAIGKQNIINMIKKKGKIKYRWRMHLKAADETSIVIEDGDLEFEGDEFGDIQCGWDGLDDIRYATLALKALEDIRYAAKRSVDKSKTALAYTAYGALYIQFKFLEIGDGYLMKAIAISDIIENKYPELFSEYKEREKVRRKEQLDIYKQKLSEPARSYVSLTISLRTFYVSPEGTAQAEGTKESPYSLDKVNEMVQPGDTVILMDGVYRTRIIPKNSGEKGKWIVFKAENPRKAVFTGITHNQGAVSVSNRSYIAIDGLTIKNVSRFIRGDDAHHIWVDRCHFENSTGWCGCHFWYAGESIFVTNSFIKNSSSNIYIEGGSHHLVENNVLDTASHDLVAFCAVDRSFMRRNWFRNPIMKLVEIKSGRRKRTVGTPSSHIFVENNYFGYTGPYPSNSSSSPSIDINGKYNVLRNNTFNKTHSGIVLSGAADPGGDGDTLYNWRNSIYHNTIYDLGDTFAYTANGIAIHGGSPPSKEPPFNEEEGYRVIANNLIYYNHHYPSEKKNGYPKSLQLYFNSEAVSLSSRIFGNCIFYENPDDIVIAIRKGKVKYTLMGYEEKYPDNAWGNIGAVPQFTDADAKDFTLSAQSPCIDKGIPLTKTVSAGKGNMITVEDSSFFTDGFGIVEPDVLKVGNERVKAMEIDYDNNRITLDRDISWSAGTPVTLDYNGKAPDIGAFEY